MENLTKNGVAVKHEERCRYIMDTVGHTPLGELLVERILGVVIGQPDSHGDKLKQIIHGTHPNTSRELYEVLVKSLPLLASGPGKHPQWHIKDSDDIPSIDGDFQYLAERGGNKLISVYLSWTFYLAEQLDNCARFQLDLYGIDRDNPSTPGGIVRAFRGYMEALNNLNEVLQLHKEQAADPEARRAAKRLSVFTRSLTALAAKAFHSFKECDFNKKAIKSSNDFGEKITEHLFLVYERWKKESREKNA